MRNSISDLPAIRGGWRFVAAATATAVFGSVVLCGFHSIPWRIGMVWAAYVGSVVFILSSTATRRMEDSEEGRGKATREAEEVAREREERLRSVIENASEIIYTLTPDGIITFTSPAWTDKLGWDVSAIERESFVPFVHPDDLSRCRDTIARCIATGKPERGTEYRIRHRDGTWRWHQSNISLVRNGDGEPLYLVGIAEDITDRKAAAELLREREERLRRIIENASETIYTISPDGVITYISPTWYDKLGRDARTILGKPLENFLHPDDGTSYFTAFREVLATGTPKRGIEYRIRHSDGSWRWRSSALSLVRDSEGNPLYLVGIADDITDAKLAQEVQARSLRRLEGVNRLQEELFHAGTLAEKFKKITDAAVSLFDLDFCRIWSVWPGDLCDSGCIHATTTDEEHRCGRREKCLHLMASSGRYTHTDGDHRRVPLGMYKIGKIAVGEDRDFLTNNVTADPNVHNHDWARSLGLVSFAGFRLHDARGQHAGVLATFAKRPLCEEATAFLAHLAETTSKIIMDHHAEEELRQAQKLEGVGQLAGGVAHEFNNLLQAISGYANYAMEGLSPEEERYGDLEQVVKASERATSLTRQLLGFSRRRVIEPKDTDPNLLVREIAKLVRPAIGEHISLDFALAEDAGPVYADAGEVQQALLNLCINARDAMPSGGKILLKTERVLLADPCWDPQFEIQPGAYVVFSVSDTGCGIPREIQQRVFEPFFTTKEVGKGTGLGLALVYGIVKQHNGAIHLYSEVGIGTTFKLYLPAGRGDAEAPGTDEAHFGPRGKETILVAEDDPMVRSLSVRTLEKAGYKVLAACDGEEAIRIFRENQASIALAVLDAIMPKCTGHEVHRYIRQASPDTRAVCCTGYDRETARSACLMHYDVPLVQKPFTPQMLLTAVRKALDAKPQCPRTLQLHS